MYTIYKIISKDTGLYYIGVSKCLETRMKAHKGLIMRFLKEEYYIACDLKKIPSAYRGAPFAHNKIHYTIARAIYNKKYKKMSVYDAIKRAMRIEILDQSLDKTEAAEMEKMHIYKNISNPKCTNISICAYRSWS